MLALKMPNNSIRKHSQTFLQCFKKIRFYIPCELCARKMVHMKYKVLFDWKIKIFKNMSAVLISNGKLWVNVTTFICIRFSISMIQLLPFCIVRFLLPIYIIHTVTWCTEGQGGLSLCQNKLIVNQIKHVW